jgi:hypothetical protein
MSWTYLATYRTVTASTRYHVDLFPFSIAYADMSTDRGTARNQFNTEVLPRHAVREPTTFYHFFYLWCLEAGTGRKNSWDARLDADTAICAAL